MSASFDLAINAFLHHETWKAHVSRGYASNGTHFLLNGHSLAVWHDQAVRMSLTDPCWHAFRIATAIPRVAEVLFAAGVLANPDVRVCTLHKDCRMHPEPLGKWCVEKEPMPKPFRPTPLEHRTPRKVPGCRHDPIHLRWETCLAARKANAVEYPPSWQRDQREEKQLEAIKRERTEERRKALRTIVHRTGL